MRVLLMPTRPHPQVIPITEPEPTLAPHAVAVRDAQTDMSGFSTRFLIVSLVLGALFVGGVYAVLEIVPRFAGESSASFDSYQEASDAHNSGDYQSAVDALTKDGADSTVDVGSLWLLGESMFLSEDKRALELGRKEKEEEAIALVKAFISDESRTPRERSVAIDTLLGFYFLDRMSNTFDAIFSGQPLQGCIKYQKASSTLVSLRNSILCADQVAYSMYPTARGAIRIASWYNTQHYRTGANPEKRAEATEEMRKKLAEADTLMAQEYGPGASYRLPIALLEHWRSVIYGMLAMHRPDLKINFEANFKKVQSDIHAAPDLVPVQRLLPYQYFYNAAFIYTLGGESRKEEARALLNKLVTLVDSDPDQFFGFLQYMRDQALRKDTGHDYSTDFFEKMSALSPEFNAFVQRYGFEF
jgi:hypothetical protein